MLPRHRFAVLRVLYWLLVIGLPAYNLPGWIQQFRLFHGAPPPALLVLDGLLLVLIVVAIGLGGWFEIQLARLPADRGSRSLYRAIENIAAQHADGDELIVRGLDGAPETHLTCLRTKSTLGFFRVAAADIDRPSWEGDRGYTAADRIRLLPKVGSVQIRHTVAQSLRAADGTVRHLPPRQQAEGWRDLAFWARTGAGIADHHELAELLAQLRRASALMV